MLQGAFDGRPARRNVQPVGYARSIRISDVVSSVISEMREGRGGS